MAYQSNNVFARILRGEIPCRKVFEDDHTLVFHDAFPKAPIHLLIIPKGAYVDSFDFSKRASDAEILSFTRTIGVLVDQNPDLQKGYRLISNTGVRGGQEVPHFHLHLLGGAPLGPMIIEQKKIGRNCS